MEREKLTIGRMRLPRRSSPTNKTKVTRTLKRTNTMSRLRGTLGPSRSHDSLAPIFAEWEVAERRGSIDSEGHRELDPFCLEVSYKTNDEMRMERTVVQESTAEGKRERSSGHGQTRPKLRATTPYRRANRKVCSAQNTVEPENYCPRYFGGAPTPVERGEPSYMRT